MKEKDLYIENKLNEIILFAEKEDESYGAIKSGSYAVKHYLGDYFKLKENLDKELREEIRKGKISPVFYYMLMEDMGEGDLAKRIGISKRKLHKHFKPEVFEMLDNEILQKYAIVFGITVEQMNFSAASSGVSDITDGLTRRLNTIAPRGGELTQQD